MYKLCRTKLLLLLMKILWFFSVRRFNLLPVLLLGGQNANASLTNLFTSLTKTARIFTRSVETVMRSRFDESRHFF